MKYQVLLCMLFLVGANSYGMDATKFMYKTSRSMTRRANPAKDSYEQDNPHKYYTAQQLAGAEKKAAEQKRAAQEKAQAIAAVLKRLADRKIKEECAQYIMRRVDEETDQVEERPFIGQFELEEISQDPVRYVLLAQMMLSDEANWIAEDQQRTDFLAPFISTDEVLEDRSSESDELSNDLTKSFESADLVQDELPSDEVGSDDSSSQPTINLIAARNKNSQEEDVAMVRRSPRHHHKNGIRKKLKKADLEKEIAAFEKKLNYFAKEQVTLSEDEWTLLLKKAQSVGFYDNLISWVCEHRDLITLDYFQQFFELLFAEEWSTEDEFQLAGIKPIKRWHESDGYLCKAVTTAIRMYAPQEQQLLLKTLHQQLKLGTGQPYEDLITKLSNLMYYDLSGNRDKDGKKIAMKKALERLEKELTSELRDEKTVIAHFVREVKATLEMKEWRFESTWNYAKSFFYLLLDLTHAYSQKLEEEAHFLIPDRADEDLVEIMRLVLERRFRLQPQYESQLCALLRGSIDLQGDKPLRDLTSELGSLIFEADPTNNGDPECALEEGAALDCLRAILEQQNGDIGDEQLLAAFAHGWGAKLGDDHFAELVNVAKKIDGTFGKLRLESTRSCMTLLEDWALSHYENFTEESQNVRRITEGAFRYIRDAKKQFLLETCTKDLSVRNADKKVGKIENQKKILAPKVEGISATGIDFSSLVTKTYDDSPKPKKKVVEPEARPKEWQFTDRTQVKIAPASAEKSVSARLQEQREDDDNASAFSRRKTGRKPVSSFPPRKALPTVPQQETSDFDAPVKQVSVDKKARLSKNSISE